MGLDTVELLVEVEKKFNIEIADHEAEKVLTISDFVNVIYLKTKIIEKDKDIFKNIYYQLKNIFLRLNVPEKLITVNTEVTSLIPQSELELFWNQLTLKTGLKLPNSKIIKYTEKIEKEDVKFLGLKIYTKTKRLRNHTLSQLVDYIVSLNYESLIDLNKIHSKYEIERTICMITSEKSGVEIHEIELFHAFTYDLGME